MNTRHGTGIVMDGATGMLAGRVGSTLKVAALALVAGGVMTPVAIAADWPIAPASWNDPILNTFGQYAEAAGGLHFHEALDIRVNDGAAMRAPAQFNNYWVRTIQRDAGNLYNSWLVLAENRNGAFGNTFELVHLEPDAGVRLDTRVTTGQLLGAIRKTPDYAAHLHFAQGTGENPWGGISKADVNPISGITAPNANRDTVKPTIWDVKYRVGAHDRLGVLTDGAVGKNEAERGDNDYFETKVKAGAVGAGAHILGARAQTKSVDGGATFHAGSADIDIVADAWDRWAAGGRRLGIQTIGLEIKNQANPAETTGAVTSFNFSGSFTTGQNYNTLRDHTLVRAAFNNDRTADSRDGMIGAGNTNAHTANWYTLTNRDDDATIEADDRNRFWNSNVKKAPGNVWNTPNGAANANDATKNAEALFPDDFYEITITAADASGNSERSTRVILLDNFEQQIGINQAIFTGGADNELLVTSLVNFKANANINVFMVSAHPESTTNLVAAAMLQWTVSTDANGDLFRTDLQGLNDLGNPSRWYVVADYNGDGRYTPQLDATTNFLFVPSPGALVLLGMGGAIAARRRRA
ncbi:MAG: hypothetical protein SFZ23_00280 [Planctomycetota bacterium]|nr:hypothetical protein [Planctomycetota bacterium]